MDGSVPIVSVLARVEDRDRFSLERTDWGSWAKNTHVGENVQVQFQATNADGETDRSRWYAWPPDG
jgi:hypothetical protein